MSAAVIPMVAEFPKTPDHLKATPVMVALVRNISQPELTLAAIGRYFDGRGPKSPSLGRDTACLFQELCEIEGPQVAKAVCDAVHSRIAA